MTRKAASVPPATVRYFSSGQHCTDAVRGDLVLVRHKGRMPALIRFGERLRCHGAAKPYAEWNHAMTVLTDGAGATVEEQEARGGTISHLSDYVAECYAVVHVTTAQLAQRCDAADVGLWYAGIGYGWGSIIGDVFYLLTGLPIGLAWGQSAVCSADAASAQRCLGLIPDRPDVAVLPCDLARYFDVRLP